MTARNDAPAKRPSAAGSDRRDQLLAIAAELFATRGYSQTTVRDIADASGILSGSLYHHFSSKEAMLDEILRDFLTSLHARFAEIEKGGAAPDAVLDELIEHSFHTIHAAPHAVALYQNEAAMLSRQPGFEYVDRTSRKNEEIWIRVLAAGQEAGVFRADMEVKLTYRFIRDSVWSAVQWYRPRGRLKIDTVCAQYLSFLHGGLHAR